MFTSKRLKKALAIRDHFKFANTDYHHLAFAQKKPIMSLRIPI